MGSGLLLSSLTDVTVAAGSPEISHLYVALAKHNEAVVGVACFSALYYSRHDKDPVGAEIILFAGEIILFASTAAQPCVV